MFGKAGRSTLFQSMSPAFALSCNEIPETSAVVNMLFAYLETISFKPDSRSQMFLLIPLPHITASQRNKRPFAAEISD